MHFTKVAGLALSLTAPAAGLSVPRNAAPEPAPQIVSKLFYDVVRGLVTVAKQQPQATPFCSSYLKIPVVTKTSTITSFTTTLTETSTITSGSTTTTDATNTITAIATQTETASATVTTVTTTTETISTVSYSSITACASPQAIQKRAAAVVIKKPSCFANYVEGKALTSACNCLSVPTSSTTTTTTLSIHTTTTVSVTVPLTIQETATATQIDTVTDTITNTATETSTVTERTTIYTATSPVIAVPTFTIYAIGGGNNGNPIADANDGTGRTVNARGRPTILQFTTVNNNNLKVLNGPYAGSTGKTDPNADGFSAYVLFGATNPNFVDTNCQVTYNADGTCPLSCQNARGTTSYDCGVYWRIGSDADVGGCSRFVPYAVGQ
ncbi:hypothetical protein ACET3X_009981 [Alternaria dauci]|uniref:Uncharacterized protein n=1 Tax=Alternaria dauci TaxID=48095 RepID=A0ABR3U8E0_9PLEO